MVNKKSNNEKVGEKVEVFMYFRFPGGGEKSSFFFYCRFVYNSDESSLVLRQRIREENSSPPSQPLIRALFLFFLFPFVKHRGHKNVGTITTFLYVPTSFFTTTVIKNN